MNDDTTPRAVCDHVPFLADRAVQVCRPTPPGAVRVKCPCCGLTGFRDVTDAEPMPCPYCDVSAVVDGSPE